MRVLLLSDDPAVALGLRQGFGEDSCHLLRDRQAIAAGVEAVVLDPAVMPGEPARAVAELARGAPLIVLLDARGGLDRRGALAAGAMDAFVKHERVYPVLGRLLREIGERRASAEAQRLSSRRRADAERLLSALLMATGEAVALLDGQGRISLANGGFARLVQRPLAEILEQPLAGLLAEPDAAGLARLLAGAGAVPEPVGLVVRGADGSRQAVTGRFLAREIGERGHCVVLCLTQPAGTMPGMTAARLADQAPAFALALGGFLERFPAGLRVALLRLPGSARLLAGLVAQGLRELLGPGDAWAAVEGGFLVIPAEGVGLVAGRRIARLVEALQRRLAGSAELEQALLAEGGALWLERGRALTRIEPLLGEIDATLAPLEVEDPAALIAAHLRRQEAERGPAISRRLNRLQLGAGCELRLVQAGEGEPAALTLPVLTGADAAGLARLLTEAEGSPALRLDLDLLLLDLAADALARELDHAGTLAVVDLHFSVLSQRRLARAFLARLRALPPTLGRALVVNLVGTPAGIYGPKLARATAVLAEITRARALTLADPRGELPDLEAGRLGLLVVHLPALRPLLAERPDLVQGLVRRVHRAQARILVREVPGQEAAMLRRRFGVDLTAAA